MPEKAWQWFAIGLLFSIRGQVSPEKDIWSVYFMIAALVCYVFFAIWAVADVVGKEDKR